MTFTITTIALCPAGGHVIINGTVAGQARQFVISKSDFALDPDSREEAVISRLRSAIKEAGASTLVQIKAAVEGKTFQV